MFNIDVLTRIRETIKEIDAVINDKQTMSDMMMNRSVMVAENLHLVCDKLGDILGCSFSIQHTIAHKRIGTNCMRIVYALFDYNNKIGFNTVELDGFNYVKIIEDSYVWGYVVVNLDKGCCLTSTTSSLSEVDYVLINYTVRMIANLIYQIYNMRFNIMEDTIKKLKDITTDAQYRCMKHLFRQFAEWSEHTMLITYDKLIGDSNFSQTIMCNTMNILSAFGIIKKERLGSKGNIITINDLALINYFIMLTVHLSDDINNWGTIFNMETGKLEPVILDYNYSPKE